MDRRLTGRIPVPPRASRWALVTAGLAGTIAVHLLLFTPLLLGSGRPSHPPVEDQGAPASGVPAMTALFFDPSTSSDEDAERQPDAPATLTKVLMPVGDFQIGTQSVSFDPDTPESADSKPEAAGDQAGRAALFGRYMGQITARVSRAWLRPRSPVGAEEFSCWVEVQQDARGNVGEITLTRCNGSPEWQLSLVHAIESASPFPAPPDPHVFTGKLTFEMSSSGFDPKGNPDGFAPDSATLRARAFN